MKGRPLAILASAILLLGGAALWFISRAGMETPVVPPPEPASPREPLPVVALPTPAAPPPMVAPVLAPPEPVDPEALRRRAVLDEARTRYRSLREAFDAGQPSDDSRARLGPALRTVMRGMGTRWQTACRGKVCRVDAHDPSTWQGPLRDSESMRAIAERIETDPDGADSAAYVLLSEGDSSDSDSADGDRVLRQVEMALRGSPEVRKCLEGSPEKGTIEYEMRVDGTGITYRVGGNLPRSVIECLTMPMTDALTAAEASPNVNTVTRTFTLSTAP